MNLSTIFCPRLSEEIYFYFKFDSESLQITFLVDFSISKDLFVFTTDIYSN